MLGFYVINKPVKTGSTKVVSIAKKISKEKCGHLGTLDPMATGVLPIAVGKATKFFDYFLSKDKKYYAIGKFGVLTDTLDAEGKVIERNNTQISKKQIECVIKDFVGEIMQTPPVYSSININGKRAYDLAREGKTVQIEPRKINIYSISVDEWQNSNTFEFYIHCSSGTYIRSLINDIAKKLNTVATTVCIIRTNSGPFGIENSNTLEELENGTAKIYDVADFVNLPKNNLSKEITDKLLNGQQVEIDLKDGESLCYYENKIIGLVETTNNLSKIKINLWENV